MGSGRCNEKSLAKPCILLQEVNGFSINTSGQGVVRWDTQDYATHLDVVIAILCFPLYKTKNTTALYKPTSNIIQNPTFHYDQSKKSCGQEIGQEWIQGCQETQQQKLNSETRNPTQD